ncbi:MAG: carbon storage regulator CsrA [Desulfotomaculum sp.]|nr:carbon storage regulator CsrA [Desulfotomaculum sp.]MCL0081494.1 carbon storage regulator CsrA [Peptococcaceae bacterium]
MLVLSRKKNQSINIGHNIKITVLDVKGDKVSIGIEAPLAIDVHRAEVYQAIQQENRNAIVPNTYFNKIPEKGRGNKDDVLP